MLSDDNKIINGLWIGNRLSILEMLTLKSFVFYGHTFHLWTYNKIENQLQEGVVIRDANQIIPENEIIVRKFNDPVTGVGKGSVGAPFSDMFRYKLLYEYGGWWVDMDVTCLKPLNIEAPYYFRDHLTLDVIGNVMKCPKGSELMKRTYEEVKSTCNENTLDWLLPNKILSKHINQLNLMKYKTVGVSNLDDWNETVKFIRSNRPFPKNWAVIHWSNEEWRMNKIDKNNLRLRNSALGNLIKEYKIETGKPVFHKKISNEIALSRPTLCIKKAFWYFLGHFKWWYNHLSNKIKSNLALNTISKAYCSAPFKSLYFGPRGDVTACCYNRSFVLGKYPENTLKNIWEGKKIEKLRGHLEVNDFSLGCKSCEFFVKSNNILGAGFSLYNNITVHKEYPTLFEFELANICNLECIMCSGEFSSAIRRNREHLPGIKMKYDDRFVNQLIEFIPYLKEAKFLGGEPFLINTYFRIWEKIIEINPQCVIDVQTNGTILNTGIKELLNKGKFRIGISVDSLNKEVYESIRLNSNFEVVNENIQYFLKYGRDKRLPLHISICPMTINWKGIPKMIEYFSSAGANIYFNTVTSPTSYSLKFLSANELDSIISFLNKESIRWNTFNLKNKRAFVSFLKLLSHWKMEALQKENKEKQSRDIKIEKIISMINVKLMNYCSSLDNCDYTKDDIGNLVNKMESVISLFEDDEKLRRALLETMNNISEIELLNELNNNSIEELYEKAKVVIV
jgi:MoaA/NifB/PqqE/SkfB family radical SAM enzyme